MGSVQSNVECPICKSMECIEDYYYKSDEVYIFCNNCGYNYEVIIKRDKKGLAIKDKDDKYIYETIESKGKGTIRLFKNKGIQTVYSIPFDDKERKQFLDGIEQYKKQYPDVNVEINLRE